MKQSFNKNYVFEIWMVSIFLWPLFNFLGHLFTTTELKDFNSPRGILSFIIMTGVTVYPPIFLLNFLVYLKLIRLDLKPLAIKSIQCGSLILSMLLIFYGFELFDNLDDFILFISFCLSVLIPGFIFKILKEQKPLLVITKT